MPSNESFRGCELVPQEQLSRVSRSSTNLCWVSTPSGSGKRIDKFVAKVATTERPECDAWKTDCRVAPEL